jgi:hypothetical protein
MLQLILPRNRSFLYSCDGEGFPGFAHLAVVVQNIGLCFYFIVHFERSLALSGQNQPCTKLCLRMVWNILCERSHHVSRLTSVGHPLLLHPIVLPRTPVSVRFIIEGPCTWYMVGAVWTYMA